MKATRGTERPETTNLQYVDDSFFAARQAVEIEKELTSCDQDGKLMPVLMNGSKTEPWKRAGRSRAAGKIVAIAWRTGAGERPLRSPADMTVVDIMRNPVETNTVEFSETPIYLVGARLELVERVLP